MGFKEDILKTPERTAFSAAVSSGLVTHAFGLFNVIYNYDNITSLVGGYGTGIPSGRWFLGILSTILSPLELNYNLPFLNGLLLILFLALSAGMVVSLFQIKNRLSAAALGMLFVVFPTVTSTMFFRYTAPPYGLAIFLAVLAAWVLPKKGGLLLSGLLTALSLGIYQAYALITITIFVIQLIQDSLKENATVWPVVRRGLYCCAALLAGILLYYGFLEIFLDLYQQELNNYQGMQDMGNLSLSAMPGLIRRAYMDFCKLPFRDYCQLAHTPLLKGCYIFMALLCGVMIASILFQQKKVISIFMTGTLCALFPLAVNFIVIMCPQSNIYTLMVYSFVLIPCLPLVLWEEMEHIDLPAIKSMLSKTIVVVTAAMIILYSYYANVNYSAQHHATEQLGHYANSILTQARTTPGFDDDKKWAFIGPHQDPMRYFAWHNGIIYGGSTGPEELMNAYSFDAWFWGYLGYGYATATLDEIQMLSTCDTVKVMPCWPDYGAMQVVEDYLVVKFQDIS